MDALNVAVAAWKRLWEKGNGKQKNKKTNKKSKKTIRRGKRESLKHYYQRNLQGDNQDALDVEEYGDTMRAKGDFVWRVGLQNVSNLSETKNTAKSRQTISYIVQKQFDIFMMTEVGLCWKLIALSDQWFERIFGKFRSSRSCFAYNKTELYHS
jgi:hypothetical protein